MGGASTVTEPGARGATAEHAPARRRWERVLSPVERLSEILFGLVMALSITGSLSVAAGGQEDVRAMLIGAVGCNTAWGIVDALMYLMSTLVERYHGRALLAAIGASRTRSGDSRRSRSASRRSSPPRSGSRSSNTFANSWWAWRSSPGRADAPGFVAALGVFLLVFVSTLPVVLPFLLPVPPREALRLSNGVALVLLFVVGLRLGSTSCTGRWSWARRWSPSERRWWPSSWRWAAEMAAPLLAFTLLALGVAPGSAAGDDVAPAAASQESAAPEEEAATWEGRASLSWYFLPDDADYLIATGAADRGALHLEARYGYEDRRTVSLFAGWNLGFGDELEVTVVPMLGAVVGRTNGMAPALELTLAWGPLEYYLETEYVIDFASTDASYLYAGPS